ncbi:MAG: GNAT family N-acetyltransferase [Roseiflexaceae bacterium]
MTCTIERLTAAQAADSIDALIELLRDSVEHGASVGFLPPLLPEEAQQYWAQVIADVERGARVLLVARQAGHIVGAVQLEPAAKRNAAHRAEVQKLLVHTRARRQGIGGALMRAIEAAAIELGRSLLVLDTYEGGDAERLYHQRGYIRAGEIPGYARSADGSLAGTVIFYRFIE